MEKIFHLSLEAIVIGIIVNVIPINNADDTAILAENPGATNYLECHQRNRKGIWS